MTKMRTTILLFWSLFEGGGGVREIKGAQGGKSRTEKLIFHEALQRRLFII